MFYVKDHKTRDMFDPLARFGRHRRSRLEKSWAKCAFRRFRPPDPKGFRPAFRSDSGHPRSVSDAGDYCFSHWPISVNLLPFFFRMDSPLRAIL